MSNAFKFTFSSGITVSLTASGESVALTVRDTGTGIAPDDLPKIFERFYCAKGARSRSHEGTGIDLRAPLRAIDGFAHVLMTDYAEVLDAQGRDYLERTRATTQRMGILIDDLLRLSRLTRHELRRTDVDLGALAREIAGELRCREPDRRLDLVIEPEAHAHLLRIVLDNFFDNAWKYN